MAEDLSIKVKVEPDGGSVQGKLDEIAKKKKFNVQIGDTNLKTQLKSISKTISGTLEKAMANTMKAIDDYAKSAQQAATVIEQAQKREQAALISNVNLLARNAQERKEITNAIQGQVAAQNKLRNETALTAAQENELRKMSNRDLTIRQLRAEQQEWEQLEKEISDVNNLIKEKNKAADTGSKKNNKKDDAEFTVDQKFPEVQKELLNLMTDDDAFDIGIGKSSEKASEDILTGFNLISDSIGKGKDAIRKAVAEFQGESGAGSIFDTFSYLFDVEGDYSGDIDAWIDAEIPDEKIKNALSKKFKSIITAASDDSENELSNAYNQYVNTISKLFEDYYAAIEKITNKASTTKDVEKGVKELQTVIVEIASTIGILPDNVKEKMLANVTEPLDKVKEAIEQRKEALKNKMLGNDEQGSNDVKLKVDIDDADTEERLKNTTETIISQLDTMAQKQRDITAAKEATVKAEQSIYTETQKSIKELQTLVEQKEQLAKKISELRSEATGIPDGKGQTEDAKMLMETLSAIDPSKVKTVLDNVSTFVDSVVKSNSELEATKTKAAEFNAAIESINKTLAISTAFLTSLTKEDKTAKGKRGGKKTQKADATEVDETVKLQQLVLNAEKAADAVKNAITNASNSISTITTELKTAATSADGAKEATRPMIEAAIALNNTFKQYSESLADIKTNAGIMNGTVTKAKRGKKATAETASMDDVAASVTKANEASTQIHTIFTKFAKIGAATDGFAEKAAQIIAASDEVNAIILAYKTTGERTAITTADAAKQQQSAAQEFSAQMETVGATLNNAGEKVGRATTALSEAAQAGGTIDASVKILVNAGNRLKRLFTSYANIAAGLQENLDKVAEIDGSKNATTYRKLGNFINNIVDFYKKSIGELSAINSVKLPKDESGKTVTPKVDAAVTEATQRFKATLDEALNQALATLKDTSGLDAKLAKAQKSTTDAKKAKTDIVNGFAEITAVFNSLTNAAKSITDSMTDLAKLKTMTDEVNMDQFAELINNSVDEQIKKISTKIRKDAMLQTSPNNDRVTSLAMKTGNIGSMIKQMPDGAVKDSYTKQFAELNDDITAFYNGSEKAATTWADIVSRTTEMAEGVKQVNKETQEAAKAAAQVADEESEGTNALLVNAAKYAEFTQAFDEATKFQFDNKTTENYDNSVKKLSADLSSVFDAIARFDNDGSDRNADILQAAIRQAEKDVADIKTQTVQLQELSKIDPAASISKASKLDVNGTESAKITRLREEFKETQTALEKARKEYEKDWSSENFDKLKIAMDNCSSAAKRLTTAVNTANDTIADNSVRSNERQFDQIKDFLANYQTMLTALQRSAGNKGFKQRDDYQQTESALKKMVEEAENVKSAADVPTFIAAMANKFKDAKTPIESVSDALNVVRTKISETKAEADKFNGGLKSQRDVNTYIKSVSNSLYTAQRYLSNNSKITTDPAIYARYLEYIERYQELLKSGKITQQNGQEYASEASKEFAELKKAVQDAGLETDTLAMKFKKRFETNIKSQFASQVISMVEQGLRQIYQNVVNIDSAMTELKKVTNETDNTYDAFLDDAGTRAKNLGASISDIVTASADFARLGYNLKDSKELADAAVLYQHVGDGISSVNDASESIISTMKAFGVEAKDVTSIVDKFNEVGKQHCPKFTISVKGWRHPRPRKDMEFNDNFLYGNREVIFFMCTRNNKGQFIKGTISNKRKHNKIPLLRLPYTLTAEQVEDKIVKFYKSLETAGYTWQQVC